MNRIYRSIWNTTTATFVAVTENACAGGKKSSSATRTGPGFARFATGALAGSLMLAFGASVYALPTGGVVSAGSATIATGAGKTTITQTSQSAAINWQGFGIGAGEAVQFVQPNNNSVSLNRVLGGDPSSILGNLTANGKVFLVNPNGILFGRGASVNVGGLVASTLNISDSDFMAGKYKFAGNSNAAVLNQGSIHADGGYVALLGANVSNEGVISAQLGTVALAAGNAVTLDVAGDGLLNVAIDQGTVNALVSNGGLIQAEGGQVLLSAQAAGSLLKTVVNNTGVIQAQTIDTRNGKILLLGDMQTGTVNVGGTLDASAPAGGNGGFIETSAAKVNVANDVKVTTAAAHGLTGTWLIDPQDFIIGSGGNIAGSTLSGQLVTSSITISTAAGTGNGDIFINDAVTWTASGIPTTLTLLAARDVIVNQAVTATNGNFVVCCGRDVNVNAAITTSSGSISLNAGRDVNIVKDTLHPLTAISTTDGNINICAANNINVDAAISLVRGSSIPAQSLGLPLGLVLNAGYGGTGGTVTFKASAPKAAVTGPNAPATIFYNPTSYASPTDYLPNFTLVTSTLRQFMYVFPVGSKTYDGTITASFSGLRGNPAGVTLVAGAGSTATFDTPAVGTGKTITFTGYSLAGATAGNFALPASCCAPVVQRTTGTILAAVIVPPVLPPEVSPVLPPEVSPVLPPEVSPEAAALVDVPTEFAPVVLQPSHGDNLNLTVIGNGVNMLPPVTPALVTQAPPIPVIVPVPVAAPPFAPPAPTSVPIERPLKKDRN